MLDLHAHLLPGIDDGPADVDGSVKLAREMAAGGVRTVAATPHCRHDHPRVVPSELAGRCAQLEARLMEEGIPIEIVPAGEADLVWALDSRADDVRLVSYAQRGHDLLLETPYPPLTTTFEALLFELTIRGYRLLLAHPERNSTLREQPGRLAEIVRRGALVQVTASSLVGSGRRSRTVAAAQDFVREGLCHVIASDAHGPAAPGRATLAEGLEAAVELVGEERAHWMVEDVPRAILAGAPLPPGPEPVVRKRGLLRRLAAGTSATRRG
jgi:protein-tyrosine phosphatase